MGGNQSGGGLCRRCNGQKTIRLPAAPDKAQGGGNSGPGGERKVVCPECRGSGRAGLLTK